jgi:hypothetical protein
MKTLLTIIALALLTVTVEAQQYRTTVKTNATITVKEAQITSTNLTVFTGASGVTWHQVTIQNEATNSVRYVFGAVTGSSNKLSNGQQLVPMGSNGDSVVYNLVIPTPLVISAQMHSNNAAGAVVTGVINIEALGN